MSSWIKNKRQLSATRERKAVLEIIEAGFDAIDTAKVIRSSVKLYGDILTVKDQQFNLEHFEHVYVLGFGKASSKAALALERVLGDRITAGIAIGLKTAPTKYIKTYPGTHPLPSLQNVAVAEKMKELISHVTPNDLVINLVSGGGSALLCWDKQEYQQGTKLYKEYLKTGDDIKGLNTVRKHISQVKGGGLAKMLYPATVISLIFSDVAGNNYHHVDSGPTYKDTSTIADAKKIIKKYKLGDYKLNETPKEDMYFETVYNIPLVSNCLALDSMAEKARELKLDAHVLSAELFDTPEDTLQLFLSNAKPGTVLLGGSEIKLIVNKKGGKGGRNSYLALKSLSYIKEGDTFAAVATDGLDNSDSAGAIVDQAVQDAVKNKRFKPETYLDKFDSYTFFEKLNDSLLFTGPTETNISDLLVWYRR